MKKIIWIIVPVFIAVMLYSTFFTENEADYLEEVETVISTRKRFLAFNEQSPFKLYDRPYSEPAYYPVDPAFRVVARVQPIEEAGLITLATSDGKTQRYTRHAWLLFDLMEQPFRLLVLKPFGYGATPALFCGFSDKTSGEKTYGGGRYLDLPNNLGKWVTLDFNLAYNPYCAYVDAYTCPLPPAENILPLAIEAGELDFPK